MTTPGFGDPYLFNQGEFTEHWSPLVMGGEPVFDAGDYLRIEVSGVFHMGAWAVEYDLTGIDVINLTLEGYFQNIAVGYLGVEGLEILTGIEEAGGLNTAGPISINVDVSSLTGTQTLLIGIMSAVEGGWYLNIHSVAIGALDIAVPEMFFIFDTTTGTIEYYIDVFGPIVKIPQQISGIDVLSIGNAAFDGRGITLLALPDGLISIEQYAFSYNNINSVVIPEGVGFIGEDAFRGNPITHMVLPADVDVGESYLNETLGDYGLEEYYELNDRQAGEYTYDEQTETWSFEPADPFQGGGKAKVSIGAKGGGIKVAFGGSMSTIGVSTPGQGAMMAIGSSAAAARITADGAGSVPMFGGSELAISVLPIAAGGKLMDGGSEAIISIVADGHGRELIPALEPARELRAKVFIDDVEYDDHNIVSMVLDETVNPTNSFAIGTAAAAKLELTLIDIPRTENLDGAVIKPYIGFVIGGNVREYMPLGVFNVEEVDWKKDGEVTTAKLTCFDNMVRLETAFILSELEYPAPFQLVAQEIVQKAGLTLSADTATNLPDTPVPELMGYTLREAVGFVASFVGGFARFNQDGELEISTYDMQKPAAEIGPSNYFEFETAENTFTIGRLTCRVGEGEEGNEVILTAGLIGNEITFTNPWMTQEQLDAIHTSLSELSYMPYTVNWQGDPELRAGDVIAVTDKQDETYVTLIMEQQLRYTGGLTATAEAKGKTDLAQGFQTVGPVTRELSRVSRVASSTKAYAERLLVALANGEFEGGTFIDQHMIISPIIAGYEGRFTGELKVGVGNDQAGISGDGNSPDSIRFWSGHAEKGQAPFRVTQDGTLTAMKGEFGGKLKAVEGTFKDLMAGEPEGARLELGESAGEPFLEVYDANRCRVRLLEDRLQFFTQAGTSAGHVSGGTNDQGQPRLILDGDLFIKGATGGVNVYGVLLEHHARLLSIRTQFDYYTSGTRDYLRIRPYSSSGHGIVYIYSDYDSEYPGAVAIHGGGTRALRVFGDQSARFYSDLRIDGDQDVLGSKSAVVETENYGLRKLYAVEAPDSRFMDIIEQDLMPGEHWVDIEPMFAETINGYVVLPITQDGGQASVLERQADRFKVKVSGTKPVEVVFWIYGKRKGYEDIYMEEVAVDAGKD